MGWRANPNERLMSKNLVKRTTMLRRLLFSGLLLGLVFSPVAWSGLIPVGVASLTALERPLVVVSIPYWDQDRAFQSFQDHVAAIDFVSLFWYTLDRNGRVAKYRDADIDHTIVDFAHQHRVKVFALIANLPDEEGTTWDWRRVDTLLKDKSSRQRFITQITKLAAAKDFDGITLDFETLRERQRTAFTRLVQELARALHQRRKLLRVSVEYLADTSHTHGKDWRAIAAAADQLAIMTYDQHWNESRPGPVASLPWVEQALAFARSLKLPMNKVSLGIPLYGYDWPRQADGKYGTAQGLQYDGAVKLRKRHQITTSFDQQSSSPYFRYASDGRQHVVWYENHRSFRGKLKLAQQYRVGSIFLWRLGGEDQGIWRTLAGLR